MRPFWGKANDGLFRNFVKPALVAFTSSMDAGKNIVTYDAPLAMYFYGSPWADPADPLVAASLAMDERRGGCAGNIAYSLALLGEKPTIVAAAGRDFGPYAIVLENMGLPLDGIRRAEEIFTALCYITTDLNSNQITGFYPGAMQSSLGRPAMARSKCTH